MANNCYVPGIDGLRAIAILSVVFFHLNHALLPGGFTGVDIFFVISGYVISKSLAASESDNFSSFILGFYKRRVLRIVPALLFFLVTTAFFSTLFTPEPWTWLSALNEGTALSAFFGVSNFFLVMSADGYFSERIPYNPFMHTWSLAVEEQFYLFFPLIFYISMKAKNNHAAFRILSASPLPIIAVLSLAFSAYETTAAHERAFYMLPSRFWELAAGALLFQVHARGLLLGGAPLVYPGLLLLGAGVLVFGFMEADDKHFPFPWALVPVVGALLMIAGTVATTGRRSGVQTLIESRPLTYIGRISYSLYLWHWPVFSLFRWTVGLSGPTTVLMALLLTFGFSIFSYQLLENRFREHKPIIGQPDWKIVAHGLGSIVAAFMITKLLFKHDAALGLNLSVTSDKCTWYAGYSKRCGNELKSTKRSAASERQLFVVGDSHAMSYSAMVNIAANILDAKAIFRSVAGCPIASLIRSRKYAPCDDFEEDLLAWITQEANPGDIVFLASLRLRRLEVLPATLREDEILARSTDLAEVEERNRALGQAKKTIQRLQAIGLNVVVDAPKPIFRAPPFRCADWFNKMNPICEPGFSEDRDFLLKYREPTMAGLEELESSLGIEVWDPFPILCKGSECSALDGDKPLFTDADHLSGYGNRVLVPSFTEQILKMWTKGAITDQQIPSANDSPDIR